MNASYTHRGVYSTFRWSMGPEQGGSNQYLMQFARECLAGGRFDTQVPWQFHLTVQAIVAKLKDRNEIFGQAGVFEDYVKLFEGYAQAEGADRLAYRKSQIVCVAFLTGRLEEARRRLQQLGDKVDVQAFHSFGLHRALVEGALQPPEKTEEERFRAHEDAISGMVFVQDGRLLVTVGGGIAHVWDVNTGRDIGEFLDRSSPITRTEVAPNRELVATGDANGRVVVWNAELRKEMHTFQIVPPVHAIAFSPDGRYLATGGGDKCTRLWDLDDGRLAATYSGQGQVVSSLAFSPDAHTIVCTMSSRQRGLNGSWSPVTDSGMLAMWDWKTRRVREVFPTFQQATTMVRYSNTGKYLAVVGSDWNASAQSVMVVDGKNNKVISKFAVNKVIRQLVFSPDDKTLFIVADDAAIRLFSTETGELLARLVGHSDSVRSVAVTPDGSTLFSGDASGHVKEWDLSENMKSRVTVPLLESRLTKPRLTDFCLKHGQRWLATIDMNGLTLWNPEDGYQSGLGFGGIGSGRVATAFDISPDESQVATATWMPDGKADATLLVWNTASGRVVRRITLAEPRCRQLKFSPDQKSVVAACGSQFHVWNIETDMPQQTSQSESTQNEIVNFSFSPSGKMLAMVLDDGSLSLADTSAESGWKISSPRKFRSQEKSVAIENARIDWFPDSSRIVLCSQSKISVFDVKSDKFVMTLPGSAVAISHDGRWLATTSLWNDDIRVLDAASGREIQRVQNSPTNQAVSQLPQATQWRTRSPGVIDLTWAPSGLLFSVVAEGSVRSWNPHTGDLILEPSGTHLLSTSE